MDDPKQTFRITRDTYFSLGASLGAGFSEKILGGGYGGNVFYFALRCLSGRLSGEIFPRGVFFKNLKEPRVQGTPPDA